MAQAPSTLAVVLVYAALIAISAAFTAGVYGLVRLVVWLLDRS